MPHAARQPRSWLIFDVGQTMNVSLIVSVIAVVAIVIHLLRTTNNSRTVRMESPRFAILDLSDGAAEAIIEEDKSALRDILGAPEQSTFQVPLCDVLFLYGRIDATGCFEGYARGLREIIRDAGAIIVVVASENEGDRYIKAAPNKPYGHANLVMTLSRNEEKFSLFFRELFSRMKEGRSMPVAWHELAPQIPDAKHPNCPGTIFDIGAGQVTFK